MKDWISVQLQDLSHEEPERKDKNHSFITISSKVPWPRFCRHCGHVPLKNEISKLLTKIGCGFEADLRYKNWARTGRL